MGQLFAYSTLAMTVALAVSRPRIGRSDLRVTPGIAAVLGVVVLLLAGLLPPGELVTSARIQWRPLLALTSVMAITGVVKEVGAFERLARRLEALARDWPARRVFGVVFLASVVTPSLLNNDAAILLLTPVVVTLAERLYPGKPKVLEALVFAVFLAPGVAPLLISNPMNMIVAEFAGLGFNAYAATMAPISLAGALLTYVVLRLWFRRELAEPARPSGAEVVVPARHPAERPALGFLVIVFFSYPAIAAFGGPIWPVAVLGAIGAVVIARRYDVAPPRTLASHVSVDILAFLWGVFLVVAGLRSVGVVERLASFYEAQAVTSGREIAVVGVVSALGSAIVDNHPMSILDMLALGTKGGSRALLATLVGGNIGPRLLPLGSLAGLLWMDLLRRRNIEIPIGTFVRLGLVCVVPSLILSLVMLWAF